MDMVDMVDMMNGGSRSLLGFGSALVDLLVHVEDDFLRRAIPGMKGGTELVQDSEMSAILAGLPQSPVQVPGGAAANTIVGYAQLGGRASMLAKIGNDPAGEFYRQSLEQSGVSTTLFKRDLRHATGQCLCMITPDSERTMRTCMGAANTLVPEELAPADFAGQDWLYIEGYALFNRELMRKALELAKSANLKVCLDLAAPEIVRSAQDILPELLRDYVDAVFANELEAEMFAGTSDPQAGLAALAELCPLAVVKIGRQGAWLQERGKEAIHVEAKVVQAVDTTGAGDLWAAGFLYGWLNGWPLRSAAELGALVASEVVQVTGAVMPDATWARLREQCRQWPKLGNKREKTWR